MNPRTRFGDNPNDPIDENLPFFHPDVRDHQHPVDTGPIDGDRQCRPHMEDPQINCGTEQILANERCCPVTAPIVYDLSNSTKKLTNA